MEFLGDGVFSRSGLAAGTVEESCSSPLSSCSLSSAFPILLGGDLAFDHVSTLLSKLSAELSGVELSCGVDDLYVLSVSILLFLIARERAIAATCSAIVGSLTSTSFF